MSPEQPRFQEQQAAFTAHIRDPQHQPLPPGIGARRMQVYSELIFNGLDDQLSTVFPVLRSILGDDQWQALLRGFLVHHRAQTPLFTGIGQEFLDHLQQHQTPQSSRYPFLLELAHYEYVELAVAINDSDLDDAGHDPNGDLLHACPVLAPSACNLGYRYPVHTIAPDNLPQAEPAQPTYLVVYRDRLDEVHFLEINAVTQRLLTLMREQPQATGAQHLRQIADELRHPHPEHVLQAGAAVLDDLRRRNIVLGARPA